MAMRTYNTYLQVPELLRLQRPLSDGPEHDEMLFIVIHQVYELWFKQVLWEVDWLRQALYEGRAPRAAATLRRILTILKTLVGQIDVLETMTPVSFNSFRARLEAASGFQSIQFREVEIALGHRRRELLHHLRDEPEATARLEARAADPSIYEAFLHFLGEQGQPIPAEAFGRDPWAPPFEDERVRTLLVDVYHHQPYLRQICELLVDLDEGLQEWRYRHVKMVQRTIGSKQGTGGSAGAGYLRSTLDQPLFPDLWAIRASL